MINGIVDALSDYFNYSFVLCYNMYMPLVVIISDQVDVT